MYTIKDLRGLSIADLQKELNSIRTELYEDRMRVRLSQEPKHHKVNVKRKYIARILMVMGDKNKETVGTPASAPATPTTPSKKKTAKQ